MKVLLQRVQRAAVEVEGKLVGSINAGLLLLTGIAQSDNTQTVEAMAKKISNLRIFPDQRGKFDQSLRDIGGAALVVPQFTLFADTSKGRRPEFFAAMQPDVAAPLCDKFAEQLKAEGISTVEKGIFGAHMLVSLVNDGPVTMMIEL